MHIDRSFVHQLLFFSFLWSYTLLTTYVREGLIKGAYLFLRTWTTVAAPLSQMNMKGQLHPLRTQFQANQAIINKLSN